MARFEPASLWDTSHTRDIEGMSVNGALFIPESLLAPPPPPRRASIGARSRSPPGYLPYCATGTPEPFSPTESFDSAFASRPSSCNPSVFSHKRLLYGAPDFSVAILDTVTGSNERLSIPAPRVTESRDMDNFSQGEVLTMTTVGESQVWAGTANGTLHIFEMTPELRFSKHVYTTLTDPVLHIASRQLPERVTATAAETVGGRDSKMDIVLGSPSGYLTIMSGVVDDRGGLKNGLKVTRKVMWIGDERHAVQCITHVSRVGVETYWCGCGGDIVIVGRLNWKVLFTIDVKLHLPMPQRLPNTQKSHVTQMLSTEQGVWSCLSDPSSVFLWDTLDYTPKKHIPCRSFSPTRGLLNYTVQISALAFSYPLLFVGTSTGHLSVFRTAEEPPVSRLRRGSLPTLCDSHPHSFSLPAQTLSQRIRTSPGYKFLGATHCGPYSIVSIYAVPAIGQVELLRSPFWSPVNSPGSSTVVVVVACGPKSQELDSISVSQVQMYELVSTPSHSPTSTPDGSISPTRISPRRRSISHCNGSSTPIGIVSQTAPQLSMVSAAPTSLSLFPLDERT